MAYRRRQTAELVRDRRRIADLYLQGQTQVNIAEELGIGQATVSRDLKAIQKSWKLATLVDFNEARAQELAKIDRLEREYWTAWLRSTEDQQTETHKAVDTGDGQRKEAVRTVRGQAGDPRFLVGVQWCIDRRCKLLGLDAADKVELSWKDEAEAEGYDADGIYDQLVEAAIHLLEGDGNSTGHR